MANVYWGVTDSAHSDMFQPGSDGVSVGTRHHVYERNFCGDSIENHSHYGLFQDTVQAGDTNIVFRGNVGFNFGSTGVGVISIDHVVTYNNTFYEMNTRSGPNGRTLVFYKKSESSDYPTGCMVANTIIAACEHLDDPIYFVSENDATITHNLGYLAGFDPSYISTSDPLFVDPVQRKFRLQAGSPAINVGTHVIWVTSAEGSGTTFNVNDGLLLIDGWGMTDGDTVAVGGTITTITSISGNSITVADSVTWTSGMPVYWGTDTTPDIGAFPYGSTELTAAVIQQSGNDYTVTPTGDARGIWFYVDGIPTTWDSAEPFTATISNGNVTAKAYALYAQANPVVVATNGDSTGPAPPANIHVQPLEPE